MSQRAKNQKKAMPDFDSPRPGPSRSGVPASLLSALEETGRIRGSSATPRPTFPIDAPKPINPGSSATPKPNFPVDGPKPIKPGQSLIHRMEAMSFATVDIKGKNKDDETVKGYEKDDKETSVDNSSDKSSGNIQKPATVQQHSLNIEAQLSKLVEQVSKSKLSKAVQQEIISAIHTVASEFRQHQTRLQSEFESIKSARDHFEGRLVITAHNLKTTTTERDQAREEILILNRSIDNLRARYKRAEAELEETGAEFKTQIDRLHRRLLHQDEQLKGKRALWLERHPSESAQRTAITAVHDPLESPLAKAGKGRGKVTPSTMSPFSSFGSATMGNVASPSNPGTSYTSFESATSGAPPQMNFTGSSRRPRLPCGTAKPADDVFHPFLMNNPSQYITHTGQTVIHHGPGYSQSPSSPNHGALVLFNDRPDRSPEFQEDITEFYMMIEGWVRKYANLVNPTGIQDIIRTKPELWAYMLNCTYPGNMSDARTHTTMLMNDPDTRFWFVMRMMTDYFFMEMIGINAWHKFDDATTATLDEVAQKLQERGLPNEERHKLVVRRAEAVKVIVDSDKYQDWRSDQLHHHTKNLRDLLGSVLNPDSDRSEAGRDLGAMAIRVFDQSAKMNSADLTFQIYFPATASKYNAGSMIAKDKAHVDPLTLQVRQLRIKLAITPVVTLRDDGGLSIKAKNLHHACVLLMH